MLKENDNIFKEKLLPDHYIQNAKTVERVAVNHVDKYSEDVKYYDEDINNYRYEDSLAREIFNETKDLKRDDKPLVEIQMEQEQEEQREEQREEKREQEFNFNRNINCDDNLETLPDEDYLNITKGVEFKNVKILVSTTSNISIKNNKIVRDYCFIELENGYYKIISLGESLLLQARNIIHPVYHYRYDPVDDKTPSLFLLAQGFCGKKLHFHEQLRIIRDINDKNDLQKIAQCYDTLRYGILLDYLNSSMSSDKYITYFAREYDYQRFLTEWIGLKIGNKFTKQYYDKCISLIS